MIEIRIVGNVTSDQRSFTNTIAIDDWTQADIVEAIGECGLTGKVTFSHFGNDYCIADVRGDVSIVRCVIVWM